MNARIVAAVVLVSAVMGCRTPANLAWTRQLSAASEDVNRRWWHAGAPMTAAELKSRLDLQYPSGEPDLTTAARDLPAVLKDGPWPNPRYPRYADWVMGQLWEQFAVNTGRQRVGYGWRDDSEFNACECWLYVELGGLPAVGTSFAKPVDPETTRDHIVHAFLLKDRRVMAAVRIEPWRGVDELYSLSHRNGDAAVGENETQAQEGGRRTP